MIENKTDCLLAFITKLFPNESDFENEIQRLKYYNKLYSIFPNIKTKLKYKNYSEKEMPIMKLILDSSTYILKQWDGPYFERYRKDLIRKWIKFYKFLHTHDKDTEDGAECKLSKSMKRAISKALIKLQEPKKYVKEIKEKLYTKETNKQMVKFYKAELEVYDEYASLFENTYKG